MKHNRSLRSLGHLSICCIIAVASGAGFFARADVAAPVGVSPDDAAKFVGVFENEKITVELITAGQGQFTGTIKLGEKQFPASARVKDGNLVGTFESGGPKFDFTASVDGAAMYFVSGKNDFHLTRKVGPLGAPGPAAAPNPLDAIATAPAGGKPPAAAVSAPADAQIFKRETLFDPFAQTDAFTVLVPGGWKMQGHANWDLASVRIVDVDVNVFDPKSGAGLMMYPRLFYTDDPIGRKQQYEKLAPQVGADKAKAIAEQNEGKEFTLGQTVRRQAASPGEYVRLFTLPRYRKDIPAKALTFSAETDLPELAKATTDTARKFWAAIRQGGAAPMPDAECRASRFRMTYTSPEGQPFDEQFTCILTSQFLPSSIGHGSYIWHADVWSCRAPAGQFDKLLPLFATVKASFTQPFRWDNFRFHCQTLHLQAKIDAKRADMEILRQAAIEKSKIESDARRKHFAGQLAAKAEAQHQEMNYIKGERDYVNPGDGTTMTLSADYRHQWVSNRGDVISTNDPRFDPRGNSPDTSWSLLEPAK